MEAEQLLGSRREARRFARVVKLLLAFMFVAIGLDYLLSRSNDPDVRRAQEKRGVRGRIHRVEHRLEDAWEGRYARHAVLDDDGEGDDACDARENCGEVTTLEHHSVAGKT